MAEPLIFVGTHKIKPGMLETAKVASRELAEFLEPNHPRMHHFEIDIDDDAREMTVIQIHPDEESLLFHLQVGGEKIKASYEFLESTIKIEIYGSVSQGTAELVNQMGTGAPVRFNQLVAGFSRFN